MTHIAQRWCLQRYCTEADPRPWVAAEPVLSFDDGVPSCVVTWTDDPALAYDFGSTEAAAAWAACTEEVDDVVSFGNPPEPDQATLAAETAKVEEEAAAKRIEKAEKMAEKMAEMGSQDAAVLAIVEAKRAREDAKKATNEPNPVPSDEVM